MATRTIFYNYFSQHHGVSVPVLESVEGGEVPVPVLKSVPVEGDESEVPVPLPGPVPALPSQVGLRLFFLKAHCSPR